jgi:hypothetical protein
MARVGVGAGQRVTPHHNRGSARRQQARDFLLTASRQLAFLELQAWPGYNRTHYLAGVGRGPWDHLGQLRTPAGQTPSTLLPGVVQIEEDPLRVGCRLGSQRL